MTWIKLTREQTEDIIKQLDLQQEHCKKNISSLKKILDDFENNCKEILKGFQKVETDGK